MKTVEYPKGVPCPPPKIPVSFEGVPKTPLDREIALLMQLHDGKLGIEAAPSALAGMEVEEKQALHQRILDILEVPQSVRSSSDLLR